MSGEEIPVSFVEEKHDSDGEWEEFMGQDICIRRVHPGHGNIAELKDIVKANIKVFLYSSSQSSTNLLVETLTNASFKIGEGDAVPGLELALRHSRQGEKLQTKCTWKFGFGLAGRNGSDKFGTIPGQSDVLFDIEILEHYRTPDNGDTGISSYVRDVAVRKENGNRWFAYGDFIKAARCFSQGGKTGDSQLQLFSELNETTETGKELKKLYNLYLDCLNNLAACHLNLNDPFKAREACIRVLEMSPNNQRGLLRAAKASLGLHEYEESRLCLTRLLEIQEEELKNQIKESELSKNETGAVDKAEDQNEDRKEQREEDAEESETSLSLETTKKNILITKQYLKKVDLSKKKYKERERGMATKIATGLFSSSKKVKSSESLQDSTPLSPVNAEMRSEELDLPAEEEREEKKEKEREQSEANTTVDSKTPPLKTELSPSSFSIQETAAPLPSPSPPPPSSSFVTTMHLIQTNLPLFISLSGLLLALLFVRKFELFEEDENN